MAFIGIGLFRVAHDLRPDRDDRIAMSLALGGVYLAAFIIEKLAPNFQSRGDTLQALKLVAYANTAFWVAGVCNILPFLGVLGMIAGGIYSIYLFYLGLPVMMKTPQDKVIPYMIVSAVVILIIQMVIMLVVGAITAGGFGGEQGALLKSEDAARYRCLDPDPDCRTAASRTRRHDEARSPGTSWP